MKIIDICLGNWIIFKGASKIDPKCINDMVQVSQDDMDIIGKIRIPMHGVSDEDWKYGNVEVNLFQGIEITSEILEKNEFQDCGEFYKKEVGNYILYYSLRGGEFTIKERYKRSGFHYIRRVLRAKEVNHVHQLQNYLSDCDLVWISLAWKV